MDTPTEKPKPCPQCGMTGTHKMSCTQPWLDRQNKSTN